MKKKSLVLIVFLEILVFLLLILLKPTVKTGSIKDAATERLEDIFFIYEIFKYESFVDIVEHSRNESEILVGMATDPWDINFGIVPLGFNSKRFLILTNDEENNFETNIQVYGNISPMIKFNKNNFILHGNENVSVEITLNSSLCKNIGNYTGEIHVVSKKAKYLFINNFIHD